MIPPNLKKKKNKNKKVKSNNPSSSSTKPNVVPPPTSSTVGNVVNMIHTDLKFVVHKDSTDDQIMLVPDPTSPEVNPYDDLFLKTPDDLHVNEHGLIDPNIKASS